MNFSYHDLYQMYDRPRIEVYQMKQKQANEKLLTVMPLGEKAGQFSGRGGREIYFSLKLLNLFAYMCVHLFYIQK